MSNKFITRWLFSTNCKDIAVLYLIFAVFSGLVGTGLSLIIRLELAGPTPQILADNGQLFNVVISAHAIFMVFFLVMPMAMGFFGDTHTFKSTAFDNESKNYNLPENSSSSIDYAFFRPYLAGLIEGDGTIWTEKGEDLTVIPKISIAFKIDDKPLAEYLCSITNCGTIVKKSGNYLLWNIQNFREVYYILFLINGYMRTPKHKAAVRAMHWCNNYILKHNLDVDLPLKGWDIINRPRSLKLINGLEPLVILDRDTSDLGSNAWLSGMTDADGNFSLSLYKKKRVNAYYRLELKQGSDISNKEGTTLSLLEYSISNNESFYPIVTAIAILFNTKVYSRSRVNMLNTGKTYSSYIVMACSKENMPLVIDYFSKYPLLSSKYLDYQDWTKIVNVILTKGQKTSEAFKLAEKIRTNYNKTRHTFNWDHLK